MNIAGTEYTLKYKAFDIYVSGCTHNCYNCFNPQAQDFNYGKPLDMKSLMAKIIENRNMIDNIRIFGGDICCQNEGEAYYFLSNLAKLGIPLTVYTGKDKDDIWLWLWDICDGIKCGKYIDELKCDPNSKEAELYGSTNQIFYKKVNGNWEVLSIKGEE